MEHNSVVVLQTAAGWIAEAASEVALEVQVLE